VTSAVDVVLELFEGRSSVGITGSVCAGKSELAGEALRSAERLGRTPVLCCTDAFLWPNLVLDERGASSRKGFPESYDVAALRAALELLTAGEAVELPVYSHDSYDIVPGASLTAGPGDLVVVDGLHLGAFARDLLGALVYLEVEPQVLEAWYLDRLTAIVDAVLDDPADTSFYSRFAAMDAGERTALYRHLWRTINLVNLHQHISTDRARADVIIRLGPDHGVQDVVRAV